MIAQLITTALLAGAAFSSSTMLPYPGLYDLTAPRGIWRARDQREVLTFDDGPDAERTSEVLDLLAEHELSATFFVIGRRACLHPALLRRIVLEGHAIGNHGWDHTSMIWLSRPAIRDQLRRTQDAIASATGTAPTLARPPFGRRDYRYYQEARDLGLTTLFWSLDSGDWLGLSAARIAQRVSRARYDDVVLFHDGNRRAEGLAEALASLLPLRARARQATPALRDERLARR